MSWIVLLAAGLFEIVWAVGLRFTDGFSRPLPSLLVVAAMACSFWLLSVALRTLPLGTAYAVWVGIGAVGAAVAGIVLFDEPAGPLEIGSLLLVVLGIAGLRLAARGH